MLARHKQLLESYERVKDFLAANVPPNPATAYEARKQELTASIARLNSLLGDQSSGQKESRDDSIRQKRVRRVLWTKHLAPISRIAKALLSLDPVARKALSMPPDGIANMKLVAEAIGFRNSAARHEQVFVENGRPADCLAQLDGAIEALRQTVLGKARSVGLHVGARAGLGEELIRARQALQVLDAMVLDAFAGNAEVLARWAIAKRVRELPGPSFRATGGTADENVEEAKPTAA